MRISQSAQSQQDIHLIMDVCSCQDPGSEPPGNCLSADASPSMKYRFAATIRSNLSAPGRRIMLRACTEKQQPVSQLAWAGSMLTWQAPQCTCYFADSTAHVKPYPTLQWACMPVPRQDLLGSDNITYP